MTITIYGIKNCDSVKKARKLLEAEAIPYSFHDFRVDGLTSKLVETFLAKLPPEKLLNKRSTTWKQLNEAQQAQATNTLATLLCEHPTLIKRPVIQNAGAWLLAPKADELLGFVQTT